MMLTPTSASTTHLFPHKQNKKKLAEQKITQYMGYLVHPCMHIRMYLKFSCYKINIPRGKNRVKISFFICTYTLIVYKRGKCRPASAAVIVNSQLHVSYIHVCMPMASVFAVWYGHCKHTVLIVFLR